MSTAHDHYLDAERHLHFAKDSHANSDDERSHHAYAQVHATLALAAAQGADRPSVEHLHTRTMSDPPAHGELIIDQMGDAPEPNETPFCSNGRCYRDLHDDTEPHVDEVGREFR